MHISIAAKYGTAVDWLYCRFPIVVMLFVYGKSVDMTGIAGLIIVIAQMVVMICAIPFTEAALKRNFNDLGRHR